jgi:hypothetical protein
MMAPRPFDKAAFERDPEKYLETVEPSRAWLTAQPAPGVKRIELLGPAIVPVARGGGVQLSVKAEPGAPVSWLSSDMGSFPNKMTAMTVRADAQGVARVAFSTRPGAVNDINVIAASPLCAGQAVFVVSAEER